jgi:hypothetical protein
MMEIKEMPAGKKVKPDEEKEKNVSADDSSSDSPPELGAPLWSVVSFERCEAGGLTYDEALRKIAKLEKKSVAGLCIVTDAAARRISGEK